MESFSLPPDLTAALIFGLIVICLSGYLFYVKRQILKLDKIIAEKEAAMNAPDQPDAKPTATPH